MRRRPALTVIVLLIVAGLAWFAVREVRDELNQRRAFPVVRELGGRIGSLPFWPFGTEYVITFDETTFSPGDLERLTVLNPLAKRHTVGVMFKDTNITRDDVLKLRRLLPECTIFRVVDEEMIYDVKFEEGP